MSSPSFEEQLLQSAYKLGRQRDQVACEKRALARQLRYVRHSARLASLSKQCDFALVFFVAMGAASLALSGTIGGTATWLAPMLGLSMLLFAIGIALKGRKMVIRLRCFHSRYGYGQF